MTQPTRRHFLLGTLVGAAESYAASAFPPVLRRALAIEPNRRRGSIEDVEHIVILTQENRSFDHYFGTLRGVRGFGDPHPIPVPDTDGRTAKTVWTQSSGPGTSTITPFHLDTARDFRTMRVSGTPHLWPDAQGAWSDGKLSEWPRFKTERAMGHYTESDLPFQFALAEAFTICDAYHCSFHGGTNPNRLFIWTGTNDPSGRGYGPVVDNQYDNLEHDPQGGYAFRTYCERLEKAGVSWRVYQDMADNFTDNPLAGFQSFRASVRGDAHANPALAERGLATRDLDQLREDVLAGNLPSVSWIVATAEGSEHPGPSSPAQGAEYTARVIEALTADPEVWSKTVLFLNFDENDGFFDHVPPPAPPSVREVPSGQGQIEVLGASTVSTWEEYHRIVSSGADAEARALIGKPYGLGPRVPMYVISPWTRGGWVCSQVFDHTSVIRFVEERFGVFEPNISPWRRAVCGDLTSAFDFSLGADEHFPELPETSTLAGRARLLPETTSPSIPTAATDFAQTPGLRPSRPLPYDLEVLELAPQRDGHISLGFFNRGHAGAVFHVYDRTKLEGGPRRYTVEAHRQLTDSFDFTQAGGHYDLWVLGPNGFHRHFAGSLNACGKIDLQWRTAQRRGHITLLARGLDAATLTLRIQPAEYMAEPTITHELSARASLERIFPLARSYHWYDVSVTVDELPGYYRRLAGHVEHGEPAVSDPGLARETVVTQPRFA
jgi:phospholipase C